MPDANDIALLQEFTGQNSEEAFAELVRRHINLVYSVALRFTNHTSDAEDVAQAVFIILAHKAARLSDRTVLTGWLYETTRFTALRLLRTQARRRRYEQEASIQTILEQSADDKLWQQLKPHLEAAMSRLGATDRALLALRFYENKTGAEAATLMGIREETARKRTNRALEKLRRFFAKRGVNSTAETIIGAISANSIQAAPLALTKIVTAAAIAKGATASTSTLTLIKGALKIMAWTKTQTVVIAGVIILLAMGATKITIREIAEHRPQPWQKEYNLRYVDTLPPQVKVLPSLPSTLRSGLDVWGGRNDKVLGLGLGVSGLLLMAYQVYPPQMIWNTPVPPGKYDFIANLPDPANNIAVTRKLIQKKFGLSVQSELINTNVFVLTAKSRSAPGLHPSPGITFSNDEQADSFSSHGETIAMLINYVERNLGTIVVDRTGLNSNYDIDFKWDGTPEGLKRALYDQLGLELTPTNMPVEMLVIEKAK